MLKSLTLTNFRMHEYTELYFNDHEQLVLIAGKNGVGKSTILEAIVYALYGESRTGRRNLDKLIKKGSELEGMSVEIVFQVGDDTYRVVRRRDGRAVTAVMYGNDIPLFESPGAVTEAVTRLLGLDSQGFRLSTIAQQKELDGLASLKPAEKAAAIKRLLKLDALTRAKEAASTLYRSNKDLWRNALPAENLSEYQEQNKDANTKLEINKKNLKKTQESVFKLEKKIEKLKLDSDNWLSYCKEREESLKKADQLHEAISAIKKDLSSVSIPKLPPKTIESSKAYELLKKSQEDLAAGEKASNAFEKRKLLKADVEDLKSMLQPELDESLLEEELKTRQSEMVTLNDEMQSYSHKIENINSLIAKKKAELDLDNSRLNKMRDIDGVCSTCGQEVGESHKVKENSKLIENTKRLTQELSKLEAEMKRHSGSRSDLSTQVEDLSKEIAGIQQKIKDNRSNKKSNTALNLKIDTYVKEINRLPSEKPSISELKKIVSSNERKFVEAQTFEKIKNSIEIASLKVSNLQDKEKTLSSELDSINRKLENLEKNDDLEENHKKYKEEVENLESERKILEYHILEDARLKERIDGINKVIEITEKTINKAKEFEDKAVIAGFAGKALQSAAGSLTTQIRPRLEGAMSSLLTQMSEGRFTKVSIDEKYEVTVLDNNEYVSLSEISGGEMDLIALALRLSLAQVASGNSGLSFLILDECFGSQDPQRRSSILESLRNLKEIYSQILIISHVENMEDYVDKVITIETSDNRKNSYVVESE